MQNSPTESANNQERVGDGHGQASLFQISLQAMIPQKIDNMLVAGKSIVSSHIAAAVYGWEKGVMPYELVQALPGKVPQLQELRKRLELQGNPIMFLGTSIFNSNWKDWK